MFSFMLPFSWRLKKSGFKLIKNTPKKIFQSESFCLKICFSDFETSKFAVIVPVSVSKKATIRNKLKRRVRAVIMKHLKKTEGKFATLLYVKKGTGLLSFAGIEKEVVDLLRKAKILE